MTKLINNIKIIKKHCFIIIACLLISFIFVQNQTFAYDTALYQKNIPIAVIEYADSRFNYLNDSGVHLKQQKNLNNYKVYKLLFDNCNCGFCGNRRYIVYHNNEIRMATPDEETKIYFANRKKTIEPLPTHSIHEALKLYCNSK